MCFSGSTFFNVAFWEFLTNLRGQGTEILQGTYFDSLDSEKEGFITKAGGTTMAAIGNFMF